MPLEATTWQWSSPTLSTGLPVTFVKCSLLSIAHRSLLFSSHEQNKNPFVSSNEQAFPFFLFHLQKTSNLGCSFYSYSLEIFSMIVGMCTTMNLRFSENSEDFWEIVMSRFIIISVKFDGINMPIGVNFYFKVDIPYYPYTSYCTKILGTLKEFIV